MRWRCFSFVCSFQSTHPSGVRQAEFPAASQPVAISIHAPQWGATREECGEVVQVDISIHAPQWGATRASGYNTNRTTDISIHAPQWGATQCQQRHHPIFDISIHAPQWGATGLLRSCFAVCLFQSTHPSGVRHPRRSHRKDPRTISIHAPQWGATGPNQSATSPRWNFNPRTPVGCDRQRMRGRGGCDDFNPRTPVGCDLSFSLNSCKPMISIHAPQWGATSIRPLPTAFPDISIHAPQWGATVSPIPQPWDR